MFMLIRFWRKGLLQSSPRAEIFGVCSGAACIMYAWKAERSYADYDGRDGLLAIPSEATGNMSIRLNPAG